MPDPVNEKADADKPPCQHLNCVRVGRVADNRWACLRCGVPMVAALRNPTEPGDDR